MRTRVMKSPCVDEVARPPSFAGQWSYFGSWVDAVRLFSVLHLVVVVDAFSFFFFFVVVVLVAVVVSKSKSTRRLVPAMQAVRC